MPTPEKLSGERALLRFLQRHGKLSTTEVSRLEDMVVRTRQPVFDILERECGVSQIDLASLLSHQLRLTLIDLAAFPLDLEMGRVLKESVAVKANVVPLRMQDRTIEVATANPLDVEAIRSVEFATSRRVRVMVATYSDVRDGLRHIYRLEESLDQFLKNVPPSDQLTIKELHDDSRDLRPTLKDTELPPIVRLVDLIMVEGIKSGASDIHIEPSTDQVAVRYRIDGVLEEHFSFPKWVQNPLMARLKVLAKLDITERRVPQDGHIQVRYRDSMIDFRISSLPAQHGEKITARVLDAGSGVKQLKDIGLTEINLQRARDALARPEGIILVTGPTGSGKTTTLYSFIKEKWSQSLNIVTIENPIEYQLKGITQVEVNPKQGLTFASVLRSILRQDPDVILVGEIRDSETARIAFQAAQTGHLVLSTIHTNDATSTINRLIDLGIEPYTISSTLALVVAQRLVRRICPECKGRSEVQDEAKRLLRLVDSDIDVQRGSGCPACRQTGYRGRIGVFEMLPISAAIGRIIESGGSESDLRQQARQEGCSSLRDDAMLKIAAGVTTPEEVIRVAQVGDQNAVLRDTAPSPFAARAGGADVGGAGAETPPPVVAAAPLAAGIELPRRTYKALVVDDDPDLRRIVRTMLERSDLGLTVITAQDGDEALTLVEIERPDVIVLDVAMPGMDGFEACRRLRADEDTSRVPVLLLTARDAAEDVTRGFREGADDYVIKPFRGEDLIARIRRMIQRTYGSADEAPATRSAGAAETAPARLLGGSR